MWLTWPTRQSSLRWVLLRPSVIPKTLSLTPHTSPRPLSLSLLTLAPHLRAPSISPPGPSQVTLLPLLPIILVTRLIVTVSMFRWRLTQGAATDLSAQICSQCAAPAVSVQTLYPGHRKTTRKTQTKSYEEKTHNFIYTYIYLQFLKAKWNSPSAERSVLNIENSPKAYPFLASIINFGS